jgi:hypothetical protein
MNVAEWDREFLFRFRAKPLEITDGDTFWALCEHPHHSRAEVSIRIRDLWAREMNQPGGPEDAARLAAAMGMPRFWSRKEWPLRIISLQKVTVVTETKSFDRYVCDVFVDVNGVGIDVKRLL